jgi:hypothetical protein
VLVCLRCVFRTCSHAWMCVWSVVLSTGDMVRQVEWPRRPSAGPQARVGERGGQSLSTPFVGRGVRPLARPPTIASGARASGEYMPLQY